MTPVMPPPPQEENARTASSGSATSKSSLPAIFGVYDGHSGPDCSRYVCDNLFRNLEENIQESGSFRGAASEGVAAG
ncbi:hypothetical protein glysoja_035240 [Glycine soja]|uniref:PPM-type phosphatase domain-containing protein n=1 Tax=Glycine soja TaxID=3848 RepID=A0A0B2SQT6_GLYSO|nr:hypothetical protein glysoja_035240 [Glycine soja]